MTVENGQRGGLRYRLTFDGEDLDVGFDVQGTPSTRSQFWTSAAGDDQEIRVAWPGPGHARIIAPLTFSLAKPRMTGRPLELLEDWYYSGTRHWFSPWKSVPAFYSAILNRCLYYLPLHRLVGPVAFGKSTARFPVTATFDGGALTANYMTTAAVEAADVAVPATAGEIWVGDELNAAGYLPVRIGTIPAGGEELIVRSFPAFRVVCAETQAQYHLIQEARTFVLREA